MTLILRRVLLAAIVIALIVVVRLFPDRNETPVDIDLLVLSIPAVELWFALGATFLGGAALTALVASLFMVRSALVGRRYRKAISDLEAEVHHLRNLPLASGDPFADDAGNAKTLADVASTGSASDPEGVVQFPDEKKHSERI